MGGEEGREELREHGGGGDAFVLRGHQRGALPLRGEGIAVGAASGFDERGKFCRIKLVGFGGVPVGAQHADTTAESRHLFPRWAGGWKN